MARLLFSLVIILFIFNTQAQNVGIGTTAPTEKLQLNEFSEDGPVYLKLATKGVNAPPAGTRYAGIKLHHYSNNYGFIMESEEGIVRSGLYFRALNGAPATTILSLDRGTNNVGIGTIDPAAKLDIAGNIKIADGTQGDGRVLTSDGDGLASWKEVKIGFGADIYSSPPFILQNAVETIADFGSVTYLDNITYTAGVITIPAAGLYHFDLVAQINFGYTNTINMEIRTYLNGNPYDQNYSNTISNDIKLAAGDQVSFKLIQSSGSPQTLSAFSRISCHKVY